MIRHLKDIFVYMGLSKEVIRFDNGIKTKIYKSAQEAADDLGLAKSCICRRCKTEKEHNGVVLKYTGNSNKVDYNKPNLPVKCPYCEKHFESYNGLCKHIIRDKMHGDIGKVQLLVDYKYGGVRPTCKCGCGEYTNISYYGGAHFSDFVKGHASRLVNNWGNNPVALKKSAITRKARFSNGDISVWNKGKTWNETYDVKTRARLRKSVKSKERAKKISNALKGKPFSDEHIKHIREACNKPEYKEYFSKLMRSNLKTGKFKISSYEEENFIKDFIKPLNVEYVTQFYIKDIHQYCDVFIPSVKTFVEFNGTYWHGDPRKYKDSELTNFQKERREKDKIKENWIKSNGYKLITVWEDDYKNRKDIVKEQVEILKKC